jgi:hypothetical protein
VSTHQSQSILALLEATLSKPTPFQKQPFKTNTLLKASAVPEHPGPFKSNPFKTNTLLKEHQSQSILALLKATLSKPTPF